VLKRPGQVTFIYIPLYNDNRKKVQQSLCLLYVYQRWQWQGTKTPLGDRMDKKSRGPVLFWLTKEQCMIMIQAALQVRSQIGLEHSEYSRHSYFCDWPDCKCFCRIFPFRCNTKKYL